jgi:hypothetical protein
VTALIDDVLARVDEAQDANLAAAGASRRLLGEQDDW